LITFQLNGKEIRHEGDPEISLLHFLRIIQRITSVKDGCSGQGACGACLVEINGKPKLSCTTKMQSLDGAEVFTLEGVPSHIRENLGKAFVEKGAVQCGFCTPGFIMRTRILLETNPNPTIEEIRQALKLNLCRCTGYKKIEEAIQHGAKAIRENRSLSEAMTPTGAGHRQPKYEAFETAIGQRPFVNDLWFEGMEFGALKFSDHPRARIRKIDVSGALQAEGVSGIFTANDIPGNRITGLIVDDWPLMIGEGEITHYIGDVLALVVATSEELARKATAMIQVDYEVLDPVTDPFTALLPEAPQVHTDRSNLLENCIIRRGDAQQSLEGSTYISKGVYQTQRIEHGFLEVESAVAKPLDSGIEIYSQGQGVYEDRRQVAMILGLPEDKIVVHQVACGGGFGGKEDITVQGHVALAAWLLKKAVKVTLSRDESIRMHPKRHPVTLDIQLGCDISGKLTALYLRAVGDTGAYASVGTKVMERVAGHGTGGYFIPVVDIESKTVYTNNIPSGAMRGFGVNQAAFALEGCIDELCKMGGFDRWKFRYDNALIDGLSTATGQKVRGSGIRACLEALKEPFHQAKYSGLACGIKNSGIGNGMIDFSDVIIEIQSPEHVILHHGWTEMGQGIHTIAIQTLCTETGINPDIVEVRVTTSSGIKTGMTTSSRATVLLGNAIMDAARVLLEDLEGKTLADLTGNKYHGKFICDWTTKPGSSVEEVVTHYSYGYAAQLVVLDESGQVETVYAAHDAGKIMNPTLFEGQIEGAVHMGLGYALTEDLPMKDGHLVSSKLRDCGILRAHETPEIKVIGVEVEDPVGPYGAKGIGEIGLVPTAAAIANALCHFDGKRRYALPMNRKK